MLPGIWMSENSSEMSERDFKNRQRFVRADGFDRREARILDDVHGAQAQHHLVFHDQDVR